MIGMTIVGGLETIVIEIIIFLLLMFGGMINFREFLKFTIIFIVLIIFMALLFLIPTMLL